MSRLEVPNEGYTFDVIARMDAAEVDKWARIAEMFRMEGSEG